MRIPGPNLYKTQVRPSYYWSVFRLRHKAQIYWIISNVKHMWNNKRLGQSLYTNIYQCMLFSSIKERIEHLSEKLVNMPRAEIQPTSPCILVRSANHRNRGTLVRLPPPPLLHIFDIQSSAPLEISQTWVSFVKPFIAFSTCTDRGIYPRLLIYHQEKFCPIYKILLDFLLKLSSFLFQYYLIALCLHF